MPPANSTPTPGAPFGAQAVSDDGGMSSAALVRIAHKRALLVLACIATAITAAAFWTIGQKKVYESEALLRIDVQPPRPLGQRVEVVSSDNASSFWNHREFFATEHRVIKSLRVAMAAVRTLGLNADPGFLGVSDRLRPSFKPVSVEDAARILISRLAVEPVKDSSLASLRYEDTDPKRARAVLDAIVSAYLGQNLEGATSVSTTAADWLNGQLDGLKNTLEKSEVALDDFRRKNDVLSISLEDQHNLIAANLQQLSREITNSEVKRSELAAKKAQLDKAGSSPDQLGATELLQSVVLGTLRSNYANQLAELEELRANLDEKHPKVSAARARLETTGRSIAAEVANIKAAVGRELRAVDSLLADLRKRESDTERKAHELQSFEMAYNQLTRTRNNNEKIYSMVLERAREADLTRMMNFNNIRVVDSANEPTFHVRPRFTVNVSLGALLGAVVGLGLAILRELSDRSLKTPADVETHVGVTCLGLLPQIEERKRGQRGQAPIELQDRDLIVAARPESGIAEAARAIRTNLMFMSPDRPYRTIAVTSAIPEDGKTTVACSLATVLAQGGNRVLLVDTDLRRPRLHRTFSVPNELGVSVLIAGQATIDEAVIETAVPNLWLLTSGPIPPNPAELLQSERFSQLVEAFKAKFDRIVFDTPPILPVTDPAIIGRRVDGVVVVGRGFRTQRSAARQAVRSLLDVKAHVIGMVLNAIDFDRHDYREYHYYYKRDGYYSAQSDSDAKPPRERRGGPKGNRAAPTS